MSSSNTGWAPGRPPQMGHRESLQDILNIAVTAEALAVTALGGALANAATGRLGLNDEHILHINAARAEEQAHYDYLIKAGAQPLALTFSIPDPRIITDVPTFLRTVISLEEIFIAAYNAAAQRFAMMGKIREAQLALQIAGVEAEHRAGLRYFAIQAGVLSGTPNDVAFEKAMFFSVTDAAVMLDNMGLFGGAGIAVRYPGPGPIDFANVKQLQPDGRG